MDVRYQLLVLAAVGSSGACRELPPATVDPITGAGIGGAVAGSPAGAGASATAGTGGAGRAATAGTSSVTAGRSGTAGSSGAGGMPTSGSMSMAAAGSSGAPVAGSGGAAPSAGSGGASGAPAAGSAAPMAGNTAPAAGNGAPSTGPKLKPATSVSMDGPYTPMVQQEIDGGAGWLFRPATLGEDGVKHPVLVWGCGSGSLPSQYMFHLSRLASHGFVIYAADSSSVNGMLLTRGLDWIFAQNEGGGELAGKLDLTNVAVGGHSLGSLSTYDIAGDPRITNTIHVDGGTFDMTGGAKLKKPAIFICGEDSTGAPNCEADYEDANVPIFYTRIMGLTGLQGHIMAAREGMDVWVAWMRWQMAKEDERRKDFLDPTCTFCTGKWISKSKNW